MQRMGCFSATVIAPTIGPRIPLAALKSDEFMM